jgi:hypothetical protein
VIKKNYPHFSHKRCLKGYPIYIEQLGGINMEAMIAAGVTIDDLLYHYVFITGTVVCLLCSVASHMCILAWMSMSEYLWEVVDPSPTARVLTSITYHIYDVHSLLNYL